MESESMGSSSNGTLVGIAIRDASRAPMMELQSANVSLDSGIEKDFRGSRDRRQVTILFEDAWQAACDELDVELPWTVRRANLFVRDLSFASEVDAERVKSGNYVITIGDAKFQATRETEPCFRMDEQQAGLIKALTPDWRGGLCCRVIEAGGIRVGDTVTIDS